MHMQLCKNKSENLKFSDFMYTYFIYEKHHTNKLEFIKRLYITL